jgi:hypothetical protein
VNWNRGQRSGSAGRPSENRLNNLRACEMGVQCARFSKQKGREFFRKKCSLELIFMPARFDVAHTTTACNHSRLRSPSV